ncbi:hypothetical protein [uncultured Sulfitobacter sp.]|uniref:HNH endonuclease n=1 Tax=uncultured Sulfitobacter sp. TaxID=191468 RepID=UPI0030FA35B7
MVFEYLECERYEYIELVRERSFSEANDWLDRSQLKQRIKKHCVRKQEFRCCYCHKPNPSTNNRLWDLEHILSEDDYPTFFAEPLNLAVACPACNTAKSNKPVLAIDNDDSVNLPKNSSDYCIAHPNLDRWSDHLSHTSYLIYTSKTPKGLETIKICKLEKEAAEIAGHNVEAIDAAISTEFFAQVPNTLPSVLSVHVPQIVAAARAAEELERIKPLIVKIDSEIEKLEAKAIKKWEKSKPFRIPK